MHQTVNLLSIYSRSHEDNRLMGIILPGRAMHVRNRALVEQEPVWRLGDVDVTGPDRMMAAPDLLPQSFLRQGKDSIWRALCDQAWLCRWEEDPIWRGLRSMAIRIPDGFALT